MKKLNLAIIGQGRSGKRIHGGYYLSERNHYYHVQYVVEADATRRSIAAAQYPGCTVLDDYRKLLERNDVDVVVNATYSEMHYAITKDLLLHGFHVLVEKPFGRTRYECDELIRIAREQGVVLAVFQQTFLAPFYLFARELVDSGKLGSILQVSLRYSNLSRRWDWQTLQKKCAGGLYNTGPHPVGVALGLMNFDENIRVAHSALATALTSGDGDDYCKIILSCPGQPLSDIEINATDAYCGYNLKLQGTRGTFKCTPKAWEMTYIVDGENPDRPVQETFLEDENHNPVYCSETLIRHTEQGTFEGTAFDIGTAALYEQLYFAITEGRPMTVTPDMAARIISVIECVHAQNPLPVKF